MANFEAHILSEKDGSWTRFRQDWEAQCLEVGDVFDQYAPDSLGVVEDIACGRAAHVGGAGETRIAALWDSDSEKYYACFMLNRALLPGTDGHTLRIRHVIVSPRLDYGIAEISLYPDVIVGILSTVVNLSSTSFVANSIRFHLRSPEDQAFFRALGTSLGGSGVFASVQTHGAWLYIVKE